MAEAISAQERARAAGAVASSGVFSDAAGVGTFASSAAAMARCGGGAPNEEARGYPFSGRDAPRVRTTNTEFGGFRGVSQREPRGGAAAEGARLRCRCASVAHPERYPGVRGRARGRSERPRRKHPSGSREMGVAGKKTVGAQWRAATSRKSENARLCTFCVWSSSQRAMSGLFVGPFSGPTWSVVTLAFNKKSKSLADPARRPKKPSEDSEKEKPRLSKLCWTRLPPPVLTLVSTCTRPRGTREHEPASSQHPQRAQTRVRPPRAPHRSLHQRRHRYLHAPTRRSQPSEA